MVTVGINQSYDKIEIDVEKLEKLICSVCETFNVTNAAVSIAVIDDAETIKINKKFLDRKENTDCISFDLSENSRKKVFDIIINGQMALRQSKTRKHSPQAEAALYVVHGLLHNLGFDDADIEQAKKMHLTEDNILEQAGYGKVYNSV